MRDSLGTQRSYACLSACCYHNQNACLIGNSSLVKQIIHYITYIDILYTNIHMLYIYDKYIFIIVSKSTSEVTVKPQDW